MSAAFSAIIYTGALVFPETILGIIDASTTLRLEIPCTFKVGSTTKRGVTNRKTDVIDIAPTIASLLGISSPSGSTGDVIYEVLD